METYYVSRDAGQGEQLVSCWEKLPKQNCDGTEWVMREIKGNGGWLGDVKIFIYKKMCDWVPLSGELWRVEGGNRTRLYPAPEDAELEEISGTALINGLCHNTKELKETVAIIKAAIRTLDERRQNEASERRTIDGKMCKRLDKLEAKLAALEMGVACGESYSEQSREVANLGVRVAALEKGDTPTLESINGRMALLEAKFYEPPQETESLPKAYYLSRDTTPYPARVYFWVIRPKLNQNKRWQGKTIIKALEPSEFVTEYGWLPAVGELWGVTPAGYLRLCPEPEVEVPGDTIVYRRAVGVYYVARDKDGPHFSNVYLYIKQPVWQDVHHLIWAGAAVLVASCEEFELLFNWLPEPGQCWEVGGGTQTLMPKLLTMAPLRPPGSS